MKSSSHQSKAPSDPVSSGEPDASGSAFAMPKGYQAYYGVGSGEGVISRKATAQIGGGASAEESFQAATSGPGDEVPHRGDMERSFGTDFSGVRSFTGRDSEMQNLGAEAATRGGKVAFATSSPSRELVAHELAHVAQEQLHGPGAVQHKDQVSSPSHAAEVEADQVASRAARGERVSVAARPGGISLKGTGTIGGTVKSEDGQKTFNPGETVTIMTCGKSPLDELQPVNDVETLKMAQKNNWVLGIKLGPFLTRFIRATSVDVGSFVPEETKGKTDGSKGALKNTALLGELVSGEEAVRLEFLAQFKPKEQVRCPLLGKGPYFFVSKQKDLITLMNHQGEQLPPVASWMVVSMNEQGVTEGKKAQNELMTDEWIDSIKGDPQQMHAPSDLGKKLQPGAHLGKKFGVTDVAQDKDFEDTARIDVSSTTSVAGIEIDFLLKCNPDYMCVRKYPPGKGFPVNELKDFVPIYLEYATDQFADVITILEPTPTQNAYKCKAFYSWDALVEFLKLPKGGNSQDTVMQKFKVLAVKAQWFASKTGDANNQNHTSGGLFQKGGSGLVPLIPITNEMLHGTEDKQRNSEWNMGATLTEQRPAFQNFSKIMKLGKELATTLEAESEFVVDPKAFETLVTKMQALKGTPELWPHFGIIKMEGGKPKTYYDTYYDIVGSPDKDKELLKRGVVLRERHVPKQENAKGDSADTFLLAVKGASHEQKGETGEKMRLAAQTNLDRGKMLEDGGKSPKLTDLGQHELNRFVKDTSTDNPFGRTLDHALSGNTDRDGTTMRDYMGEKGQIKPVLKVISTRYKFLMELAGSTAIDFSADEAYGVVIDPESGKELGPVREKAPTIHSFEFGVGHPGLTATSTGGSGGQMSGEIMRPYHVPKDLKNEELFEKGDYKQFQELRDKVLNDALSMRREKLEPGGNKAQRLAKLLGLI